jgi:hypothetical protein
MAMAVEPTNVKQLEDPEFLQWVRQHHGQPIKPNYQDFDPTATYETDEDVAHQYRLSQARKLIRLYDEWKAGTI